MKKTIHLSTLLVMIFSTSIAYGSTTLDKVKNNYPTDPNTCVKGQMYDDGSFIYTCQAPGVLCATYCIIEDEESNLVIEADERVTYDQTSTLRCERDATNAMSLIEEDVSSVTVLESKPGHPQCK